MNIKLLTILFASFLSVVAVLLLFLFITSNKPSVPDDTTGIPRDTFPTEPTGTSTISREPTASTSPEQVPVTPVSIVNDEVWKNIQERWVQEDQKGLLYSTSTYNYFISYSKEFDRLSVHFPNEPINKYRAQAEEEVLRTLSIPEKDICAMQPSVTRRTEATAFEWEDIGFTFCFQHMDLED